MLKITAKPQTAPPERFSFGIDDASQALGIGRSTLYALIKAGEVKIIKIAGRTLIPRSELERLTALATPAADTKQAA